MTKTAPHPTGRLNLEDIAQRSGVSRSTVSRVINHDPNVNALTRQRVEAVIEALNFQPNAAARSLARGRSHVLGLVIPQGVAALFSDPYFPIFIQGVAAGCNAHDHSVMLWLAEPEYERRTIHQILHSGLIDGVIVSSMLTDDQIVQALDASRKPYVLAGRHPTNPAASYVDVENAGGAAAAVSHLLRLGRRRIAIIAGPQNQIAGLDRRAGALQALQAHGISPEAALMAEADFTEAGGYAAMRQLLAAQPEAVFAASDMMALGALRALREAGRRVPEDVAVMGFDDIPLAGMHTPALSTVRQPIQRLGGMAVELLIELIKEPTAGPKHLLLPTELVVRQSCGGA